MTKNENLRLCGGTFFTLLLEARKQLLGANEHYAGKKDGLTEYETLIGLARVIRSDLATPMPTEIKTIQGNASEYKKCKNAGGGYFPFGDKTALRVFDERVKNEYVDTLRKMCRFVDDFIDAGGDIKKDELLVKALVELISLDNCIDDSQSFYIKEDGTTAQLLWGYKDGGKFTSELPAHLMSHMARLSVDKDNRVVIHSHPTNTLAMNYVHELDEKKFTHTLWEMCTECIVVFPDGVGILPWMLCGTNEIGEATAEKMKEFRLVIWAMHGIYGAGKTLDETFGLIETVEKAAQIYMLTAGLERKNTIKDEDMIKLAEFFKVDYRKDFLNI